jgi:hypothetical protein
MCDPNAICSSRATPIAPRPVDHYIGVEKGHPSFPVARRLKSRSASPRQNQTIKVIGNPGVSSIAFSLPERLDNFGAHAEHELRSSGPGLALRSKLKPCDDDCNPVR